MKINPAHNDFWFDESRIILFYGGKGAGKSYTVALRVLYRLMVEENHRILCIHKYQNKIKDTIFKTFTEIIDKQDITDSFHITENPLRIVYKENGNEVVFLNLENEKIGSTAGISSVWIDEAHFITENDWVNIVASLGRSKDLENYFQFILSFNPFGGTRHWLKKRFFDENPYNAVKYKTTWKDNEFLIDDYEQVALNPSKHNKAFYMAAKYGEFADAAETQVFKDYRIYNSVLDKDISANIDDYKNIQCSVDWGHRHAACALLTATKDDTLIVFDEVYHRELTTQQFINCIVDKQWNKDWTYWCDSANPDKIVEMTQNGFKKAAGVKKGAGSIAYSIDVLLRHNIVIMPHCVNLLEEIENYSYKFNEKTSEIFNTPADHQNDDAVDALRYSIESLMDQKSSVKAVMALY